MDPFLAGLTIGQLQRWSANPDRTTHYGLPLVLRDPSLIECVPQSELHTRSVPFEPPNHGAQDMSSPPHLIGLNDEIIMAEIEQMEDDASYNRSTLGPQGSHRSVRETDTDVVVHTRTRSPEAIADRWQGAPNKRRDRVLQDEDTPMEQPCRIPDVIMPPPAAGTHVPRVTQPMGAEMPLSRGRGRGYTPPELPTFGEIPTREERRNMRPPSGLKLSQRKRPSAGTSHTVTSQAEANARAREEEAPFDDAASLTRTLSTTSMSEIEMESTESTPAKVSRRSEVYVKITVEDENRLKDCICDKNRMSRWYVHRAFLRMSMEYEVEAMEADTRALNDLEGRLTTLRTAAAEKP